MKKIVSGLMALGLLAMNVVPALAATAIADVSQN